MIQEGFFNTFITLFVTKTAGITREKENDLDDSAATKGQKLDRRFGKITLQNLLYKQDLLAVVILEIGKVLQADFHLAAILIHLESEVCF